MFQHRQRVNACDVRTRETVWIQGKRATTTKKNHLIYILKLLVLAASGTKLNAIRREKVYEYTDSDYTKEICGYWHQMTEIFGIYAQTANRHLRA